MNRRTRESGARDSRHGTTTSPGLGLGVDVGRVISGDDTDSGGGSMFTDDWQSTPLMPGAVDALIRLNESDPFGGRIYLVSKAGPKIEERSRAWLLANRFFDRTGIPPTHLFIVRQRADKASVCRRLSLTHFVDDRISVLTTLGFLHARYLFAPEEPPQVPPGMVRVTSWPDFEERLRRDVVGGSGMRGGRS